MSAPAVVIELAAQDVASPYAATLVSSCTEEVRVPGGCTLGPPAEGDSPAAIAIVAWDGAERKSAHLEVGIRRGDRSQWVVRDLGFSGRDQEVERWRAVGLVVATVVGEVLPAAAKSLPKPAPTPAPAATPAPTAPPPPQVLPPKAEQPAPRTSSRREYRPWWLDAGASVARGADASPSFGVLLRATRRFESCGCFVTASGQYLTEGEQIGATSLDWGTVGLGFGGVAIVPEIDLVFEMRAEGLVQRMAVRATDSATGASDEASRTLLGARQGASVTWMWSDPVGIVLGADAFELASGTLVSVHGVPAARSPNLGWDAFLGARLAVK